MRGLAPDRCVFARRERYRMDLLGWAIVALVVALAAALLGFTGVARGAATIARVLFSLFIIVAIVLFVMSLL
jgi:uncharacterized membrane protein YtjA (UPF0391 family)